MSSFSDIIAGCMGWGVWGENLSSKEMTMLMHTCLENDITTFDHADIYGDYSTESSFGKAFVNTSIPRENIQLISKCGIQYLGKARANRVKHYNYSKEYIIWSAERSLSNLKTEYLDLFLLHRPSPLMHPHEIAEAISQLQDQGKIKQFGVSNFTASQLRFVSEYIPVSVNQIEISITHFSSMLDGTLTQMQLLECIPMAWKPLGSYFKESNAKNLRIEKELKFLSEKYQASTNQLLLAWLLQHPSGIIPVVGSTKRARLEEMAKVKHFALEIEDWFALLVASQGHKVP
ncbi:aldo/keto reductase family oxidoreductase [Tenacibaculum sp. SG-28]|uniref:aldo/keto reductase n=1 Tax=Tenacibaculum sp. SG-28 TaxID=754426 RepID=UPI000CF41E37|nr:aldo/keto reductase [Tenacibaculum sp. SG-28]PQJ21932.1 aldo/keto reductase [Tenacibaculum sp. SG-28]